MASILDGVRARRDAIRDAQVKRIVVPRWENPSLTFRVRPVDSDAIARVLKGVDTARDDMDVLANATVVALAIGPGRDVLFEGLPAMSLKELGAELGMGDEATARDVVREVVITDGDLKAIFDAVTRFSGYDTRISLVDEELAGE